MLIDYNLNYIKDTGVFRVHCKLYSQSACYLNVTICLDGHLKLLRLNHNLIKKFLILNGTLLSFDIDFMIARYQYLLS